MTPMQLYSKGSESVPRPGSLRPSPPSLPPSLGAVQTVEMCPAIFLSFGRRNWVSNNSCCHAEPTAAKSQRSQVMAARNPNPLQVLSNIFNDTINGGSFSVVLFSALLYWDCITFRANEIFPSGLGLLGTSRRGPAAGCPPGCQLNCHCDHPSLAMQSVSVSFLRDS